MSLPGHYHYQVIGLAIFNAVFVPDGTSGLDEGSNTGFMSYLYTIIEREKCIRGQYRTVQVEIELPGFFNRMSQGIYATRLSATFTYSVFVFNPSNGITF